MTPARAPGRIIAACMLAALAACSQESTNAAKPAAQALQFGPPLSARLQDTYMRTCNNCHRNDVPGIPRAGDAADWQPRAALGLDVLTQRAMYGYKGMPPMGLCHECEESDIRALVAYMAGLELTQQGGQ